VKRFPGFQLEVLLACSVSQARRLRGFTLADGNLDRL
jgi:hypothetical protein